MEYVAMETEEQGRLSKVIGILVMPETTIQQFILSKMDEITYFSKKGVMYNLFLDHKKNLHNSILTYEFPNLEPYLKRQRKRVKKQAEIIHTKVCEMLPKLFKMESDVAKRAPTKEETEIMITYNIYLQLRDNCEDLLTNILIVPNKKKIDGRIISDAQALFREKLEKYGFFNLAKVCQLSNSDKLVDLLFCNMLPYQIAMFDFLGFIEYIKSNHSEYKIGKRNEIIALITNKDVVTVRKNINYIDKIDSAKRYTASLHKKTVINDYSGI